MIFKQGEKVLWWDATPMQEVVVVSQQPGYWIDVAPEDEPTSKLRLEAFELYSINSDGLDEIRHELKQIGKPNKRNKKAKK